MRLYGALSCSHLHPASGCDIATGVSEDKRGLSRCMAMPGPEQSRAGPEALGTEPNATSAFSGGGGGGLLFLPEGSQNHLLK